MEMQNPRMKLVSSVGHVCKEQVSLLGILRSVTVVFQAHYNH